MMRQDRFTEQAQQVLSASQEAVRARRHNQWGVPHVLFALTEIDGGLALRVLEKLDVDVARLKARVDAVLKEQPTLQHDVVQIYTTPEVVRMLEVANAEAERLKDDYVGVEHLLIAIADNEESGAAGLLAEFGVTKEGVYRALQEVRGRARVSSPTAESSYQSLERYSADLTKLAREGKLDPVIGRETEVRRVMQILNRRTKNNPVVIGEAGVGKTAIVEGPGPANTPSGDAPASSCWGARSLRALDLGAMLAGSQIPWRIRGAPQDRRLKKCSAQRGRASFSSSTNCTTVVGAGGAAQGALDAGNLMKPALARGELQRHRRHHPRRVSPVHRKRQRARPALCTRLRREPRRRTRTRSKCCAACATRYEAHHKVEHRRQRRRSLPRASPNALRHRPAPARQGHRPAWTRRRPSCAWRSFRLPQETEGREGASHRPAAGGRRRRDGRRHRLARDYESAAQSSSSEAACSSRTSTRDSGSSGSAGSRRTALDEVRRGRRTSPSLVAQMDRHPRAGSLRGDREREVAAHGRRRCTSTSSARIEAVSAPQRTPSGAFPQRASRTRSRPIGSFIFLGAQRASARPSWRSALGRLPLR